MTRRRWTHVQTWKRAEGAYMAALEGRADRAVVLALGRAMVVAWARLTQSEQDEILASRAVPPQEVEPCPTP